MTAFPPRLRPRFHPRANFSVVEQLVETIPRGISLNKAEEWIVVDMAKNLFAKEFGHRYLGSKKCLFAECNSGSRLEVAINFSTSIVPQVVS